MEEAQIEAATTLRRSEQAVYGELPEETVLLDVEAGAAMRLNASGAWLWERLEEPSRVDELARALAEHYGIGEELALADTLAFAREMARRELLELSA